MNNICYKIVLYIFFVATLTSSWTLKVKNAIEKTVIKMKKKTNINLCLCHHSAERGKPNIQIVACFSEYDLFYNHPFRMIIMNDNEADRDIARHQYSVFEIKSDIVNVQWIWITGCRR